MPEPPALAWRLPREPSPGGDGKGFSHLGARREIDKMACQTLKHSLEASPLGQPRPPSRQEPVEEPEPIPEQRPDEAGDELPDEGPHEAPQDDQEGVIEELAG
jgi:hypothetical protein